MKTLSKCTMAFIGVAILATTALAQRNGRATAKLSLHDQTVSIDYGQPALKGRAVEDMLGKLPAGGFWRLGADQSTTFTTSSDLAFGDVTVPKGVYSLWAEHTGDNEWKLAFNKQHGQWGTDHDSSKDFAFVPLKESQAGDSAEKVTIELTHHQGGGAISIRWGNMELATDFTVK